LRVFPVGPDSVPARPHPWPPDAPLLLLVWLPNAGSSLPHVSEPQPGELGLYGAELWRTCARAVVHSAAESDAEVRSSSLHRIAARRLRANHPFISWVDFESTPPILSGSGQRSAALKPMRQLRQGPRRSPETPSAH